MTPYPFAPWLVLYVVMYAVGFMIAWCIWGAAMLLDQPPRYWCDWLEGFQIVALWPLVVAMIAVIVTLAPLVCILDIVYGDGE